MITNETDNSEESWVAYDADKDQAKNILRAHRRSVANTVEELRIEILIVLEFNFSTKVAPTRLADLNRRFGVTAKRLGFLLSHVIDLMLDGDEVLVFEHRSNALIAPKKSWNANQALLLSQGLDYAQTQTEVLFEAAFRDLDLKREQARVTARERYEQYKSDKDK